MSLSHRLDFLFRLFDTNMSKLARAINVDPSLISKWRSGSRRLLADSVHLIAIAKYFIESEIFYTRKDMLAAEFKRANLPVGDLNTKKSFERALMQYISLPFEIEETKKDAHKEIKNSEVQGCMGSYEIFQGIEGKRNAVIKFLKRVLDSSMPMELFLFSQEEMSWLTGDKTFFIQWGNLLSEVVRKGHKIKIIHNVNRNPSEIVDVIEKWLPLHMTGKIEAWFIPKYSPLDLKTTIFVAKEAAAIMSTAIYNKPEADYSFYYTTKETLELAEGIFQSLLMQCKKLFNVFNDSNFTNYTDSVFEIENQLADSISFCPYSTATMSPSLYEKLVNAAEPDTDQREKRINMHKKRIEAFENSLNIHKHIEFEYLLEPLINKNGSPATYKSYDLIYNGYLILNRDDHIIYLKNLLGYIRSCEQFEYIILDKPLNEKFHDIHFYLKKEKGMIISLDTGPVAITFTEPTAVCAFEDYLMAFVESIPNIIRSKERNIKILEKRIERLEQSGDEIHGRFSN